MLKWINRYSIIAFFLNQFIYAQNGTSSAIDAKSIGIDVRWIGVNLDNVRQRVNFHWITIIHYYLSEINEIIIQ